MLFNESFYEYFDSPFPFLDSVSVNPLDFSGFMDFRTFRSKKDYFFIPHFFIDDSYFESVWNTPNKYLSMFRDCGTIVMPDFSIFYDMPLPLKMFNKWRSHVLARFYSDRGVIVIPNISLGSSDDFKWSSFGFPKYSDVAFSFYGAVKGFSERMLTLEQWEFMQRELCPRRVFAFAANTNMIPDGENVFKIQLFSPASSASSVFAAENK